MNQLQKFNDKPVRTAWSEEQNKWYYFKTDVADTEQLFRLIQRITSPNAKKPLMKDFDPLPLRIIHKFSLENRKYFS